LQENFPAKFEKFKFFLEDLGSLYELAVVTDVTNHLNTLNLNLKLLTKPFRDSLIISIFT